MNRLNMLKKGHERAHFQVSIIFLSTLEDYLSRNNQMVFLPLRSKVEIKKKLIDRY